MESWSSVVQISYDDSGNILPTTAWKVVGAYGVSLAFSDALTFGERPLSEGLEGYVLVVDVTDTFGNTYTSMVTPIGAEAAKEEMLEPVSLSCDMDDGDTLLFQQDSLAVRLESIEVCAEEPDALLLLHISADNTGTTEKTLSMVLPTLNGTSIEPDLYTQLSIPAGEAANQTFELSLLEMIGARITSPVEMMEIVWKVYDENLGISLFNTQITCEIPWESGIQVLPVSSYDVAEEDIYADAHIELSLIALAQEEDGMRLQLQAQNLTEHYQAHQSEMLH